MTTKWIGEMKSVKCKFPDDIDTIKRTIADVSFDRFVKAAYASKDGYSIRINPITNKREMLVAGTRSLSQWALNAYDGLLHKYGLGFIQILDPWRFQTQAKFSKIASLGEIDVIYGHSRGGAIVADMKLPPCTQRVGLDAAMMIAKNKNMVNLNEGGSLNPTAVFDQFIGQTGKHNVTVDYSPYYPHKVWNVSPSYPFDLKNTRLG